MKKEQKKYVMFILFFYLASKLPLSALRLKRAEVAAAINWVSSSLSVSPSVGVTKIVKDGRKMETE